jgi:diacylglycerol kinase (ATP)
MTEHLLLLVNPYAGKKKSQAIVAQIAAQLSARGLCLTVRESQRKGYFTTALEAMDFSPFSAIGIVGGDGTIHEVVNGLNHHIEQGRALPPLLLFPAGTGNSLATDLGCQTIMDSLNFFFQKKKQKLDVFKITGSDHSVRLGFNVMGFGIVSRINQRAERWRWMGGIRYSIASIVEILYNPSFEITVHTDTQTHTGRFSFVIALNTIHTGKGMKMAPKACLDDGLLDVLVVPNWPVWTLLRFFPKVFSGAHLDSDKVIFEQSKTLRMKYSGKTSDTLILDGEILPMPSILELEVLSHFLELLGG